METKCSLKETMQQEEEKEDRTNKMAAMLKKFLSIQTAYIRLTVRRFDYQMKVR